MADTVAVARAVAGRKRYPDDVDPVLGYAPGRILSDELMDYRSEQAAEAVLLHRYRRLGLAGIHNVMMLVDNCRLPAYFQGAAYEERYLSQKLSEERLDRLAKAHLGGDDGFRTLAFNRTTAANLTVVLALARPGSTVPYLVVPYARPGLRGHGHPSIPRAIEVARARWAIITTSRELRDLVDRADVSLVTVCASYRGLMDEAVLREACQFGRQRAIPVFVDDASGARLRTLGGGQPRAIDLGADLVVTSTEKYGLDGPRAGLVVGRRDLMERVGAKAAVLGTEARPSVVAAMVRCLEEFTVERGQAIYREWEERHRALYEAARVVLGDRVSWKGYGGVSLMVEDIIEIAMERAGLEETEWAPVDISTAVAMVLLRKYGYMTIPALHYPGASKALMIHLAQPSAQRLTPDEIVRALDDAFTIVAGLMTSRSKLEALLFDPPDTLYGGAVEAPP
jgi:L-seryl-tRNA(Ser) seleniumtransferase